MQNLRQSTIHDARYVCIIKLLIQARKTAGISQLDLANKLGFSQPDISKIERLERRLDITECLDMLHIISNGDRSMFTQLWDEINECHQVSATS